MLGKRIKIWRPFSTKKYEDFYKDTEGSYAWSALLSDDHKYKTSEWKIKRIKQHAAAILKHERCTVVKTTLSTDQETIR